VRRDAIRFFQNEPDLGLPVEQLLAAPICALMAAMSPLVIRLPMSGRRHNGQQLSTAERAHHAICARLKEVFRVSEVPQIAAWALSEWNIRQCIGGLAADSSSTTAFSLTDDFHC
jgi:hypothetical protein